MPPSVTPGRLSNNASGVNTNTPVSRSNPIKYKMQKPTGNKIAPTIGEPVCTATVTAKTADKAKVAPAINALIKTSLVAINNLNSPASTIIVTNSEGTQYDIVDSR